jgi:hypothetical protein
LQLLASYVTFHDLFVLVRVDTLCQVIGAPLIVSNIVPRPYLAEFPAKPCLCQVIDSDRYATTQTVCKPPSSPCDVVCRNSRWGLRICSSDLPILWRWPYLFNSKHTPTTAQHAISSKRHLYWFNIVLSDDR